MLLTVRHQKFICLIYLWNSTWIYNEKINKLEEKILQLDANIDWAFELLQTLEDQFDDIKNIIIQSNFFSLDRELAKTNGKQ